MATEKQIAFVTKLAQERLAISDEQRAEFIANVSKADTREASKAIDGLLQLKPLAATVAVATRHQPDHVAVVEEGMYRTPGGTIYKVQRNLAQGDGSRLYGKRLDVDNLLGTDGEPVYKARFVYEAGVVHRLQPEWRMTLEQAKEFGALYGTCCVCGRTLTDERSIADGIGPICSGRL